MRTEVVPMRARNIASWHHTVAVDASASEVAATLKPQGTGSGSPNGSATGCRSRP